jgi:agmatinase
MIDDMEPLNSLPKYNLFGLENQNYKESKIIVLPIPYDSTVTYKSGTRDGPHAIIEASRNIEPYSYELDLDISKFGIFTTDEIAPDLSSPENMIKGVSKEVELIVEDKKIPLILGGEHTLTLGALTAFKNLQKDISVIQFDAHADMHDEIFNSKYTHASVMARANEMFNNNIQIGIRSVDSYSIGKLNKDTTIFMEDLNNMTIEDIIKTVDKFAKREVYITIDLDVLDPSEMPSVGTPEPGGMKYTDLIKIIKGISKRKMVVGMDIVELSPIPYLIAPNYLAAKLAYLSIGSILKENI